MILRLERLAVLFGDTVLYFAISFKAKFENVVQFETCAALESKSGDSWSDPSLGDRLTDKQVL